MGKPWKERDRAPWGDGDPDGEDVRGGTPLHSPGWGDEEHKNPRRAPDSDFPDRSPSGGGGESPVVD